MIDKETFERNRTLDKVDACARGAYECLLAFREAAGDYSLRPWEECTEALKKLTRQSVLVILKGKSAEQAHEGWVAERKAEGWSYGLDPNPATREHPNLVPFRQLKLEHQDRETLMVSVVRAMADALHLQHAPWET